MEIIIGRDPLSRKLSVIRDGKQVLAGVAGSVPMDVSRQHISLQSGENGKWKIKNLNDQNVTYVNGVAIEQKEILESDRIELGASRFMLSWEVVRGPKVETVDIRPLKRVWENYKEATIEIEDRQKNNGILCSVPMGFSMLGGLLTGVLDPQFRPLTLSLTAIALLVFLYGLYRRMTDNGREEKEELVQELRDKYVCPKCGRYFGPQDYEVLIRQTFACPKCKSRYKV